MANYCVQVVLFDVRLFIKISIQGMVKEIYSGVLILCGALTKQSMGYIEKNLTWYYNLLQYSQNKDRR